MLFLITTQHTENGAHTYMTHTLGLLNVDSQDRAFSKVITEETIAQSEEATQMREDTKTAPGVINWRALAAEFTWENLWTNRDYKSIGKHFLVSFCTGLFFSGFDIFTDGTSGFTFIFGADYIKNVVSRVSHFYTFFELSYTLVTTQAPGV